MIFRGVRPLRRALAAALAAALCTQSALAVSEELVVPEDYVSPFHDVAEENWFYPYVAALNSRGVVDGYDDGGFHPNEAVTWGAALLMVQKAAGLTDQIPGAGAHWASGYAQHALSQGWITVKQSQNLNAAISRLEVARLTARVMGLDTERTDSPYGDVVDDEVTALYEAGVMTGSSADNGALAFYPDQPLKRSEMCVVVCQVMKKSARIFFGGKVLDALPGVPVCSWEPERFYLDEEGFMGYDDPEVTIQRGIDVSYFQGDIDWERVAQSGVEFAIVRAGGRYYISGEVFEDVRFRENMEGAKAAGLEIGVYFFSQAISEEEAEEEARIVLELLRDYEVDGPVVFDWEIPSSSARTHDLDSQTLTAAALAFCRLVEEAGYQPMIYTNLDWAYNNYDLSQLTEYPTWIAHYEEKPGYYYDYAMWQYTDQGAVDGIEGDVDLNIRLSR